MNTAAVLDILLRANTTQANAALAGTQKQLQTTAATASRSATTVGTASRTMGHRIATGAKIGALGLAGVAVASTKLAIDFEREMRNVNSIAQLPERSFKRLNDQVLDLAGKTAQAPETLAEGLYDLVSSGFKADEAIGVLGKTAKAATAGLTDTKTSTKAVAAALNAYRLPAQKAGKVSDIMFRTVDRGVISFEELAGSIGMVLPAAAALDVDLAQVGASIATLTKQGQSGANAVTNINAAMTALFKPSEAMKGVLEEIGVESADALTGQYGFQGALEKVIAATDGTKEAIGELFPNVRAIRAVFGLTGDNAKEAAADVKELGDSSGATARALREQAKSMAFQWQKFTAELKASAIRIGQKIIPALRDMLDLITNPHLTLSEKIGKLGGKIADVIASWGPKILAAGAVLGVQLAQGLVRAFWEANIWGKMLAVGVFLKLLGGNAAIKAIGTAIVARMGLAGAMSKVGKTAGSLLGRGMVVGFIAFAPKLLQDIKDALQPLDDWIDEKAGEWGDKLGDGFSLDLPGPSLDIPSLDDLNPFNGISAKVRNSGEKMLVAVRETYDRTEKIAGRAKLKAPINNGLIGETDEKGKKLYGSVDSVLTRIVGRADTGTSRFATIVGRNFGSADDAAVTALAHMGGETQTLLKSLNISGKKGGNVYIATKSGGSSGVLAQRGAAIVGGSGSGDKIPAMLEPGEVVLNRELVKAMGGPTRANRLNAMVPRFAAGGVAGGLDFALGPYDIPPIAYAADHAGSNSHVHITGSTTAWVVAIGKQLQRMGFMVGEHPAFGGVQGQHSATGGHYDARAIDVNSAADETRNEVASIARLLGGKSSGAISGIAEKIARVLLKGPDGPIKNAAQAMVDRARAGMNKHLRDKMITAGSPDTGAGALSESQFLGLANRALAITDKSPAWGGSDGFSARGLMTLAKAESSLIPSSINNWDSNAAAGNPSGGLMHLTQSNMRAYAEKGLGSDMFNPLASIAASINYQIDRYGGQVTHSPYQRGGIVGLKQGGDAAKEAKKLLDALGKGGASRDEVEDWNSLPNKLRLKFVKQLRKIKWGITQRVAEDASIWDGRFHDPALESKSASGLISPKLQEKLKFLRSEIRRLTTLIPEYESIHTSPRSQAGEELSPTERTLEILLNETLLGHQGKFVKALRKAIPLVGRSSKQGKGFWGELVGLVGESGNAGTIAAVKDRLWTLRHPEEIPSETAEQRAALLAEQNALLQRQLAIIEKQQPIFDQAFTRTPFGGVFHDGGVVPGPYGANRMVLAQGGEVISPAGGAPIEVTIVVNDGAVNGDAIDVRINDKLAKAVRTAGSGAPGRKAVYR